MMVNTQQPAFLLFYVEPQLCLRRDIIQIRVQIVFILAVTLLTGLIFACGFDGAVMVLAPEFTWGKIPYAVFKSLVSGAAAGYAAFYGMVFFSAKFQTASSEAEV